MTGSVTLTATQTLFTAGTTSMEVVSAVLKFMSLSTSISASAGPRIDGRKDSHSSAATNGLLTTDNGSDAG